MQRTFLFLMLLTLFFVLFLSQAYRIKPRVDVPPYILDSLYVLANQALKNLEVPVGAVLVYGDSIIGSGYNTVVRDAMLSGHAEINALNDAHKRQRTSWGHLDRSKLVLYSTYEPCDMCKGMMLNTGIRHAVFEGPKSVRDQINVQFKDWLYDLKKRRLYAPNMQENLFRRHPGYPGN